MRHITRARNKRAGATNVFAKEQRESMSELPDSVVEAVNARRGGYNLAVGLTFVSVTPDELEAELEVDEHHRQPYGLVHGGVLSGMVESLCSTGAALSVFADGKSTVGRRISSVIPINCSTL